MSTVSDIRLECAENMISAIRELGIVPFFKSPVPGYSIQEMTSPDHWFDSSDDLGPWDWKIDVVQSGDIAYGKFLCGGKAGFATVEWYAHLMNWRRSQQKYRPDANERRILEVLRESGDIGSKDIRQLLGVKKGPADNVVAKMSQKTLLLVGDIRRVYKGPTLSYQGWQTCSFCTPEALFGGDAVGAPAGAGERVAGGFSGGAAGEGAIVGAHGKEAGARRVFFGGFSPFSDDNPLDVECSPSESRARLAEHIKTIAPCATEKTISRLLD